MVYLPLNLHGGQVLSIFPSYIFIDIVNVDLGYSLQDEGNVNFAE